MKPGDRFGIEEYYNACQAINKHNEEYEEKWDISNPEPSIYECVIATPLDPEAIKENRILELKKKLQDTDYIYNVINEGDATQEYYAEVIANRKAWRAEVRELEGDEE